MKLPPAYAWLGDGTAPRAVRCALEFFGTHEGLGNANNPIILGWAKELGLDHVYTADSVPWCGLFMAKVMQETGWPAPKNPLWALNWKAFGVEEGQPSLGDVLVFVRDGGGHVCLYVGEDQSAYHCLGGNEGDAVSIVRIDKKRLYAVRSPPYSVRPASAVPHILAPSGALSKDEK